MANIRIDPYFQEVSLAAMRFQELEEALKTYLATCFTIIKLGLNDKVAFEFTRDDVDELPLGRLVSLYEKYTTNPDLLRQLKPLPKKRNYIAHKAYLLSYKAGEMEEVIATEKNKVIEISKEADFALQELFHDYQELEEELENQVQKAEDANWK